jgi:xanthine dehydrogenase accessory factor
MLRDDKNGTVTYKTKDSEVEAFIECFPPPERLVIIGGVHVAIPLHRLAKQLGYHVTVVDARGLLANTERFPLADQVMVEWPDEALQQIKPDRGTSIVVLSHDEKFDIPALLTALRSEARYIGAIGSRTTNEQRFARLREEGMSEEQLARIHAPIGLDIGGKTPSEIALAVLAEVVATRYGREGGHHAHTSSRT